MRIVKKFLKIMAVYGIYIIDVLYIRKRNMIVFFQSRGKYDDNPKVLFEYLLNHEKFEVYWLYETLSKEKENNKYFIKRYSIKGLHFFLKARFAVISHGDGDFGLYQKNRKFKIQVWHGTPIKNIGVYDPQYKLQNIHFDLFVVGSEFERHYISSAYRIDANKILVSGLPRNDYLLSSNTIERKKTFLDRLSNKKTILYAPTFRDVEETVFFPFEDFYLPDLVSFLLKHNAVLLVRPHPNDKNNLEKLEQFSQHSNETILLATDNALENINDLLPCVDVIVTDYSSIYIDLLLKDIPPIFIPYDLEKYTKERGLAYDYDLVTPGSKVATQKEFLEALSYAFHGASSFHEHRIFVKKMFHAYEDGRACERIVNAIKELT